MTEIVSVFECCINYNQKKMYIFLCFKLGATPVCRILYNIYVIEDHT